MSPLMAELIEDGKKEIAMRLLANGKNTIDDVAECCKLSVEQVEELSR